MDKAARTRVTCAMARHGAHGVSFIHLRTHSAYSLSEGALPIKQMAQLARSKGMPALAITDTGNLFGALEFSEALADKGIQPIIGCTLKVDLGEAPAGDGAQAPGPVSRQLAVAGAPRQGRGGLPQSHEAVEPRLSRHAGRCRAACAAGACWSAHREGLICLTGGPARADQRGAGPGPVEPRSRAMLERCTAIFGDRLYVELQRHGTASRASGRSRA